MIFNKCTYFRYDKCTYFRYAYHRALRIVVVIPAILTRVKESVSSPLRLCFSYGGSLVKFQRNVLSIFKIAELCTNFIENNEIFTRASPRDDLYSKV